MRGKNKEEDGRMKKRTIKKIIVIMLFVLTLLPSLAFAATQTAEVLSVPPNPPSNLTATLNEDGSITLTWTLSDSPDVANYSIYVSNNATPSTFNFSMANKTVDNLTTTWLDENATLTPERYYIVRANNTEGKEETNNNTVGKFTIPLYYIDAWNLVSTPLEPHDTSPASIFSAIKNNCTIILAYNASESRPWKRYVPHAPPIVSTLNKVDHKMGIWVKMKKNDNLTVTGSVPVATSINLKVGWNLIGYPNTTKPVGEALSSISGNYDAVYAYNATYPEHWKNYIIIIPPFYYGTLQDMVPGSGYWVNMTSEYTLEI